LHGVIGWDYERGRSKANDRVLMRMPSPMRNAGQARASGSNLFQFQLSEPLPSFAPD
jgi:hypothetical protein